MLITLPPAELKFATAALVVASRPSNIGFENVVKVYLVDVRQRFEVEHGGVVDQDVDRAEGRHGPGDHGFDIRGSGQV
ncbi:MAG: hypothetical protein WAO08_06845 [Hyphomicrobiaceae bacterium]